MDEPSRGEPRSSVRESLPITVLGGYLGAGKTTLLNSLLAQSRGRRIGVIVNDFGELGIDADMIESDGATDVVNLANGCVCCTLGGDLHETLTMLADLDPPLDHIVVEASGVADPAATSAWGTVPPFVRGGTIVLVACDSIATQLNDRYVGGEVKRQIVGADLVVLTKADRCDAAGVDRARRLVDEITDATVVEASWGDVDVDVVLGPNVADRRRTGGDDPDELPRRHAHLTDRYVRWSFVADGPVRLDDLRQVLARLPDGLLRLKGTVEVGTEPVHAVVNVVGPTVDVTLRPGVRPGVRLEAIGLDGLLALASLEEIGARLTG